jgi:myo-inositol-1(or 4)-monophosphatase
MTGELFSASEGGGATLNGEPIRASMARTLLDSRIIGEADMFALKAAGDPTPPMQFMHPAPSSLAYRICLVASGRWDAAIRLQPTQDWDIAAAVLIHAEAGGIATDPHGAELMFNRPSLVHPGVLAAGANLHPLLMARLKRTGHPS